MEASVRQAATDDLEQIAPLFDGYRQFYGQPSDPALARDFLNQRLSRQESIIFLASSAAGTALGFTQLYPSFSSVLARRSYILNDLFVAPAGRRQGIASLLLKSAAEFSRSHGVLRLSLATARSNEAAQRLYESSGWQRDEVFCYYSLTL